MIQSNSGIQVGVFAVMGRIFMSHLPVDDPFSAADRVVSQMARAGVKVIVCDVHAEASSEKVAMGHFLDGRCYESEPYSLRYRIYSLPKDADAAKHAAG